MTDLLGPASAANAVTSRLTESRVFDTSDTWFKPCSNPASQDGTQVQAAFLNGLLAQMRALIRGNGNLATGAGPIVPETNTDDGLMLKAVEYLIQRGQMNYAADQGTANHVVANLTPAPPEIPIGFSVAIKMAAAPTGSTVLNLNGSGNLAVLRLKGAALIGGEWAANDVVELVRVSAGWQIEGLTASDIPTGIIHAGDDSSSSAGTVTANVHPPITAYASDHVFLLGAAHACAGATNANLNGLGNRPITRCTLTSHSIEPRAKVEIEP